MKALVHEREKAVVLRRKGKSYSEILSEVSVSKSTLSLWLHDLSLTENERLVLKRRKDSNISLGRIRAASELRRRRLEREKQWFNQARKLFVVYKNEPFFHAGIALYWAEGAKRDTQWSFINSDAEMLHVMNKWLLRYCDISQSDIFFRLHIQKIYPHGECEDWWSKKLSVPRRQFLTTVYKGKGTGIKKRPLYRGCVRIEVRKSKQLLCTMKFWQNMVVEYYDEG